MVHSKKIRTLIKMDDKGKLQSDQYNFPYHYIPFSEKENYSDLVISRSIDWGLEYLMVLDKHCSYAKNNFKILDLGCGDGRLYSRLCRILDNFDYLGVDSDYKAINLAKLFNPKAKFLSSSVEEVQDKFDLIYLCEVLEHIPDNEIDNFLKNLKNLLNENTKVVISVPSNLRPVISKHYRHYSNDLLKSQLESNGFKILEITDFYTENKLTILLSKMLSNSFFTINNKFIKKFLVKQLVKITKRPGKGAHIFAVCSI